jgi:hypothetical protein
VRVVVTHLNHTFLVAPANVYIRDQVAMMSGLSRAHIAAEPIRAEECRGVCEDWASLPSVAEELLEAVSAALLMVGAVAMRLPTKEEVAAHQQVLRAWWVWDVMRLVVGATGEGRSMSCDLGMYLTAMVSSAPGNALR